jgi:hypothetical protein
MWPTATFSNICTSAYRPGIALPLAVAAVRRAKNVQSVNLDIYQGEKMIFIKTIHVLFIKGLYIRKNLS